LSAVFELVEKFQRQNKKIRRDKMKKIQFCSSFLMTVLFFTSFTALTSANETNQPNVPEVEFLNSDFTLLPNARLEWCRVSLSNPRSSLNVRTYNGRIVGKVKHGTRVFVTEYEDDWARISIQQGRRLVSVGWVSSEYLIC